MADIAAKAHQQTTRPWHLWVVGIAALLWNAAGAYTIFSAQAGTLPDLEPGEAAYYAAQPGWFVALTDLALLTAIAGALGLLIGKRWAVWMFALSLFAIIATNLFEFATGVSRALENTAAMVVTALIVVLAVLELAYAAAMKRRAILG